MKSILKLPIYIWVFATLLIYSSVLVSPLIFKYSGVVSIGVPIIILINLIYLILSIVFKWKSGFVALVLLIIAYPFYRVGVSFSGPQEPEGETIKVLNYNVKWFTDARNNDYKEVLEWINNEDADILCFQEYYPLKNISARIAQKGKYKVSMHKDRFHVAIYSKHPIINDGLVFPEDELNNVRFATLKVGKDTIRVYSVHLESMGINPDKIQDPESIKQEYEDVKNRFVTASTYRTEQIKTLFKHVEACPYPVLIAGDFNDVPFSYNYFQFKSKFKNAFEEVGSGFGVTYNGKIPLLRIDNQFYSEGLTARSLKTVNNVYYSDHFPLIGIYEITH